MTITQVGTVVPAAQWPQGDIRDPLGVWGMRQGITADATGGELTVNVTVPSGRGAAYVYTIYSAQISKLTGAVAQSEGRVRILTSWPNVDPLAGVQAYGSDKMFLFRAPTGLAAPIVGPEPHLIQHADRFLLCFDPRPSAGALVILQLTATPNTDLETWSFEAYGYFWDRSVLQAPGGPRHPGSS